MTERQQAVAPIRGWGRLPPTHKIPKTIKKIGFIDSMFNMYMHMKL